ncbi:hypothetical protein E2C01_047316 [Portunus trituberculatus]|uniref:Uncharacterized protein n=1 Tax=Portunus trituberculatus TaxID=210409 RepID=A0A5B7G7E2_PORTR|nr:hypothetical protein [Portunus trituberculatus]
METGKPYGSCASPPTCTYILVRLQCLLKCSPWELLSIVLTENDKKLAPDTYKEYVYASRYFSRATSDARLYVVLPCATSVVVAALVLVAGLHSRQFFSSTFVSCLLNHFVMNV